MSKIRNKAVWTAVMSTALAAVLMTGCGQMTETDQCGGDDDTVVLFFSPSDHHYHYGSPTGKVVPAAKVPSSARKVPGYKPPAAPKGPSLNKPAAPKPAPPRPAPRIGGRR